MKHTMQLFLRCLQCGHIFKEYEIDYFPLPGSESMKKLVIQASDENREAMLAHKQICDFTRVSLCQDGNPNNKFIEQHCLNKTDVALNYATNSVKENLTH